MVEKNSVVLVSFDGKDKVTGKIFDTTNEETAKKSGLHAEGRVFKSVPVVVGKGELIPGLDDQLQKMAVGEEKTFEIPAEKAFGERNQDLIKVIPLTEFKKRDLVPFNGMVVDINERLGRVQSVSGGRVRVDFNHELAGKTVEYKLKIEKKFDKAEDKAKALYEKFLPSQGQENCKLSGDTLEISVNPRIAPSIGQLKQILAGQILENISEIKKVKFVEEYSMPKKTDEKKN
ncbi:MAG: peptidylprolyl isomerase [Candidatus Diapherotrites archaeon]|nr:peptidylprolyl isomerase [Candidatus Diapherotrites archaeon]